MFSGGSGRAVGWRRTNRIERSTTSQPKPTGGSNAILRDALVTNLLEFGRIVHAEMAAITDAARLGRSLKGMTLFARLFPAISARAISSQQASIASCLSSRIQRAWRRALSLTPYLWRVEPGGPDQKSILCPSSELRQSAMRKFFRRASEKAMLGGHCSGKRGSPSQYFSGYFPPTFASKRLWSTPYTKC